MQVRSRVSHGGGGGDRPFTGGISEVINAITAIAPPTSPAPYWQLGYT